METTFAHVSDIHAGRFAHPDVADRLVEDVNALGARLVVVSGDLTQRARPAQFAAAAALLARFEAPVLVVPGNHDVYAWWHRPLLRVFRPLRRYRRYFGDELMPTFEHGGVAVLGLNTAFGLTIKGGYVAAAARDRIRRYFGAFPADVFKVLAVHHPLMRLPALGRHGFVRHAGRTLAAALDAGVDLILCGHIHVACVAPVAGPPGRGTTVVAGAGTATSDRGRGAHRATNSYNVVTVEAGRFSVEIRRFDPAAGRFAPGPVAAFDRPAIPVS